jgi:hypothetical protein
LTDKVAAGLEISKRIDALISHLRERGETAWADRLDVAVAGGATGTESLVRAGATLRELKKSGVPKRLGCDGDVSTLDRMIGRQISL